MHSPPEHAIAIVGLAGRWPDAVDNAALWANLIGGHEAVRTFTPAELRAAGVPEALIDHPDYVPRGTTLPEHDRFDPGYFGLSPRDAERLDPQQRVLLELAVAALEDAGYGAGMDGAVGVFVGAGPDRYRRRNLDPRATEADQGDAYQRYVDSDPGFAATRIAWHLGLTGPAINVLTACSTGLVAVHMACQSLLAGESDLALAGAASMTAPQRAGYLFLEGMIAAPDGHCRAFDAAARGTLGGNGAGMVALRRLEDALADGDAIRAVIRGTAINNDGRGKISYTAPSVDGQAAVIREALAVADVEPGDLDYIEAHGTGTTLGDPIEVAALNQAFAGVERPIVLGAIKTHIGHADTAAGLAGLTKVVLALENSRIPPTLHFERPNPAIAFADGPFRVDADAVPWPPADRTRRAGVSAFGVGGTNAHAVVEEAPRRAPSGPGRRWQLLPISAKTPAALDRMAARLEAHLGADAPADVAWTLSVGREAHAHRRWARTDGAGRIEWSAPSEAIRRRVAFLLPGQGTQYVGMGRALYADEPVFRAAFDRCAGRLLADGGPDLRALVYGDAADRLRATAVAQPAIFAVSYATAALLATWGITPDALLGHSVGELVAATLAGVFTPEDAVALVAARGRLMNGCPSGAMLAVELSSDTLARRLRPGVTLAAENGPTSCVIAGPHDAIDAMRASLDADAIECRRLHTSHAFHSAMMASAVEPFAALIAAAKPCAPRLPIVSGLTGEPISDAQATDPRFWARQLVEPVRFGRALSTLTAGGDVALVEVGPGRTLSDLARRAGIEYPVTHTLPHPRDGRDAQACALDALGVLWATGVEVDWRGVYAGQRRRRVSLPTYAFERRRCWIEPPGAGERAPRGVGDGPHIYAPGWRRLPRTMGPLSGDAPYLVFADGSGVGAALIRTLRAAGRRVVVADPGPDFREAGDDRFSIRPDAADDHRRLIAACPGARIVHLWALDDSLDDSKTRLERGPLAALALAHALAEQAGPGRTLFVGRRLASVHGEPADPERAALLGLARVVPQEHPHLRWRVLDADPAADEQAVARAVLAELAHAEPLVAHRGRHRWVFGVEPITLAPTAPDDRKSWLITGGAGRIGRSLTAHLTGRGARVAVLGRTARPELANTAVMSIASDATDRAAVADAIARAEARFGTLDGVIHAAADTADVFRLLGETGPDDMRRHFAVKVEGLRALDAALGERPGLLRVAFSSLASTLGGLGFAAYAAANAALDAAAGDRWLCIGWDGWRFTREGASTDPRAPAALDRAAALTPQQGIAAFEQALGAPVGDPILVAMGDLAQRLRTWAAPVAREPVDVEADDDATPARASVAPPRGPIEETIAGLWRDLLGVAAPGRDEAFWDLGGHSLLGTRLIARIRETFAVAPTLRDLFDAPTIAGLAVRVEALRAAVEASDVDDVDDDMEEGFL